MTEPSPKYDFSQTLPNETWVWVIIQSQGGADQLLGQFDAEHSMSFIPVFLEKESARKGMERILGDKLGDCYVQAMQLDHLAQEAFRSEFHLFILTDKGEILEKIKPTEQ